MSVPVPPHVSLYSPTYRHLFAAFVERFRERFIWSGIGIKDPTDLGSIRELALMALSLHVTLAAAGGGADPRLLGELADLLAEAEQNDQEYRELREELDFTIALEARMDATWERPNAQ